LINDPGIKSCFSFAGKFRLYPAAAFLCLSLSALFLASCARVQEYQPGRAMPVTPGQRVSLPRQDITHIVGPGETLWRISKMYDVRMSDITGANDLSAKPVLKMGQRLLVPRAAPVKPIIPLYPTRKWKYIIIHHSATEEDNALSLFQMHLRRGFDNGLGYDFLIANGTRGKKDGQIEVSPRWLKQMDGAHCKASNMNSRGIGVCLVGNFSRDGLGEEQMDSLVYTVNILRKYYSIPLKNIMGHGQVPGARTECPGKYFPYNEFFSRLRSAGREN